MERLRRVKPGRYVGVATVAVVLVSACAGSPAVPGDSADVGPSMVEIALRDGSDFQKNILEDGVVTAAEYERAYAAAVGCMRDAGLEVIGPRAYMAGRYLTYSVRAGPGPNDAIEACAEQYHSYVGSVWAEQQTPTGDDAIRVRDDYIDCLSSVGIEVPEGATLQDVEDAAGEAPGSVAHPCIEQYSTAIFILPSL